MRRVTILLPLIVALALMAVFAAALLSGRDAQTIPSALLDKKLPPFSVPLLTGTGTDRLRSDQLKSPEGTITLLNIWASWCTPCLAEHPYISDLARHDHIRLAGLNYKDEADAARRFLDKHGDPYETIGVDRDGAVAIDLGVYGVPETYLIDNQGIIRYKVTGPITPDIIETELTPLFQQLITAAD